MNPLLFPPLFAVGMVVLLVAFVWWIWPMHQVVVFAFYYNPNVLKGSEATIRIRRLNRKWMQRSVFGSCTVWHDAKTGERQPTYIERVLADRWALEDHRWREPGQAEARATRILGS